MVSDLGRFEFRGMDAGAEPSDAGEMDAGFDASTDVDAAARDAATDEDADASAADAAPPDSSPGDAG